MALALEAVVDKNLEVRAGEVVVTSVYRDVGETAQRESRKG